MRTHRFRIHYFFCDEYRLEESGYNIGHRVIEMVGARERITKRETRIVSMLQFVSNVVWRHLFNKAADNLERSMENEDECALFDPFLLYSYVHLLSISPFICTAIISVNFKSRYDPRERSGDECICVRTNRYGTIKLCSVYRGYCCWCS